MKRKLALALMLVMCLLILMPWDVLAQSVVDSNIGNASGFHYAYRRYDFYAAGRYWSFYVEANNLDYRTNTDPDTLPWSAATTIRALGQQNSERFSIAYDGTYGYYAASNGVNTYFRKFTPNSDGTISTPVGGFAEQTVVAAASNPNLAVDSAGCPWITSPSNVYKSSTADGSWVEDAANGFPYPIETNMNGLISLTTGRMALIMGGDASKMYAKRYVPPVDGGPAWGALVYGTSNCESSAYYSAVGEGDTVHITFINAATHAITYTTYSYSTNSFGAETVIAAASNLSIPAISRNTSTGDLDVYWMDTNVVHFARRVGTTWSSAYHLVDPDPDVAYRGDFLNTAYNTSSIGDQGVYYLAGGVGGTNMMLKFKHLSEVFNVETLSATAVTATTATMNGEITSLGFGTATNRGFYINTIPSLVGATQHDEAAGGYGVGAFSHGVAGLLNGLDYFYIAYASNAYGTKYGLWVQFTAGGSGSSFVVETLTPTNISSSGATFNANVLNVGPGITWHGFEYGKTVATMIPWVEACGNTTGAYSHPVTGLAEDTLYYVRAMIGNGTATSYGEYVGFFTIWTSAEVPAKAYMDITVTGNCTSDYDYVSLFTTDVVHTALVNAGYINGNATDTQLTVFMNGAIPYLPVSDRLAFMLTDFANNEVRTLRYYLGTTALQDDFLMTVGFNGNMTTADKDALEPGNTWQIDVSGYLDMSSGNASNWNKYIYYKQDALSLYIGGLGNLTATIGNDTAPTKSISISGIDSGSHILTVKSNAVDFRLYVDGTLMASTPTSSVGNNTNPWYFMGNNSLVAMDYFKLAVATNEKLWYQPTALVTGTTVVDRDGTGNGTINWGTNPSCITITVGSILSNSIPPAGGGNGTMWTAPDIDVSGWFGGCASVASQPFYASFLSAATDMGMPVCSLYLMVMLGCAAAIGLGTLVFTGSIMISVISTSVAMLAAANTTVVPVYLLFVFALMAISIVYLSRQT